MYDEVGEDGKHCYTVQQIADEFGVHPADHLSPPQRPGRQRYVTPTPLGSRHRRCGTCSSGSSRCLPCLNQARLSRSILHLVTLGAELRERGIDLHVIEQGIDTATMEGRAMFGMLSVLAEI